MKKTLIILAILLGSALLIAVSAQRDTLHNMDLSGASFIDSDSIKRAEHESKIATREAEHAEKQAAFQHQIDSTILSKAYQFNASSMDIPAIGLSHMLQNPNFTLSIWEDNAEIYLPYIRSQMPPYQHDILNYTVPIAESYNVEMSTDGWIIKFTSTLRGTSQYVFTLEVSSKYGGANLIITNPWYREVQYYGTITPLN